MLMAQEPRQPQIAGYHCCAHDQQRPTSDGHCKMKRLTTLHTTDLVACHGCLNKRHDQCCLEHAACRLLQLLPLSRLLFSIQCCHQARVAAARCCCKLSQCKRIRLARPLLQDAGSTQHKGQLLACMQVGLSLGLTCSSCWEAAMLPHPRATCAEHQTRGKSVLAMTQPRPQTAYRHTDAASSSAVTAALRASSA